MAQSYADIRDGVVYNLALAEAEHAALMGWIPAGNAQIGDTWDGENFHRPAPPALTEKDFNEALYRHFNEVAQADRWDDRNTLLARAGYPNQWQALAQSFGKWVNTCEVFALDLLDKVMNGEKEPPASIEAFLALLPVWEKD